ncbi:MAG TPA: LysM peptidoglycan-binding domain-containing protein [Bacteroidales bacterium]|nr:LysM peptidoglycan-binding domain-containing protein [Bacteroidales bacterium]
MKIIKGCGLLVMTVFLLNPVVVYSQVPVEISSEKVIISGYQYYIHTVKKGQTRYSITRAYGITLDELYADNPSAEEGLNEGQTLKIPVKAQIKVATLTQVKAPVKDESRYIYHRLKPGETIYSLSRLYGVSESEIVQSNSGIEINKLPVGSEIAVPKRDFMNPKERFVIQDQKYFYHKVEKGETLSSIARKYGLTLREIRKENKNVRFPQVGDTVRIPASNAPSIPQADQQVVTNTLPPVIEDTVPKLLRPEGFTPIGKLEGSIDIAVLLPLYLEENMKRPEDVPEEWIYPLSTDFLEMYNGILLATDTLRSLGLDIRINTFDIKSDTLEVKRLINSRKLDEMDLIIGPVFSPDLRIVSRYASERGIPVVSPVSLINNSVLEGNQTTFMANASLEVAQKALSSEISRYYASNLVFIHTDSLKSDVDVKNYRNLIFSELNKKTNYEEIQFKELIFYPRTAFRNDSINRISHSLSENRENIIIIASEDPVVVSRVLSLILDLSKRYNVKVFGYPSMKYLDDLDTKLFFELNQLILSPYRINYSEPDVRQFNLDYLKKFLTMPVETSYAWIGYDICYYFISGIATHGKTFIDHPEIHNPKLLQNEFVFERESAQDGFENKKLFRLRYTKTYDVVEEK